MNHITAYTRIRNGAIQANDHELYRHAGDATQFISEAYKALNMQYAKFHKMDAVCKLGILATEALFKDAELLQQLDPAQTAIVLANRASSLDTDRQHQRSISDKAHYFPSPAVFVYTLPNIVIGEIAIKYKFTGENAFFVSERFDAETLCGYTDALLDEGHAKAVIGGWVDVDGPRSEALIYLVESGHDSNKNTNFKPHSHDTIYQLYSL